MPWCVLSWRLSPRHPAISCRCTNPCLCLGWDYSHSQTQEVSNLLGNQKRPHKLLYKLRFRHRHLLLCSYDLCIKYLRVFTVQTMLPHTSPQMLIKINFQLLDVQKQWTVEPFAFRFIQLICMHTQTQYSFPASDRWRNRLDKQDWINMDRINKNYCVIWPACFTF